MDRLNRDAILIRLIEKLQEKGSWCGETHVQKSTYLLQELTGTQTGFEFILYKHGPYSFDLSDEIEAMRADGFVSLRVTNPKYGPSLVPDSQAESLKKKYPKTLGKHEPFLAFVADRVGDKRVGELERLGTALFVYKKHGQGEDTCRCADRIHGLKPHISASDAKLALATVKTWLEEAKRQFPSQATAG